MSQKKYTNEDWLRKKYIDEELSTLEIAEICEGSSSSITRWLKRFNIETRNRSISGKSNIDTKELKKLYVDEGMTTYELGKKYNVTNQTICRWLEEMSVNKRKGGPSPKEERAKRFRQKVRKEILRRDNYTCQDCNKEKENLHAHHIKPSSKYPDLEQEKSNGVTLCISCHAQRHENKGDEQVAILLRSTS